MQEPTQSTTRRTQRTEQPTRKSTARDQGDSRPRRTGGRGARRPDDSPLRTALQEPAQDGQAFARPAAARRQAGRATGTGRSSNNGLGRYGEQVAARRLVADGLRILERNWRCAEGELDIVALDGETLAVCEVKTRSERSFQQPSEAIDATKADRLRRLAERWLAERWPVHFAALAEGVGSSLTGPPFASSSGVHRPRSSAPRPRASIGSAPDGSGDNPPGAGGAQPVTADPHWPAPPPPGGVRIDLVAVINRIKGAATVEHLRGVV